MHIHQFFFTSKHLRLIYHVSILRSPSGSCTVPC